MFFYKILCCIMCPVLNIEFVYKYNIDRYIHGYCLAKYRLFFFQNRDCISLMLKVGCGSKNPRIKMAYRVLSVGYTDVTASA